MIRRIGQVLTASYYLCVLCRALASSFLTSLLCDLSVFFSLRPLIFTPKDGQVLLENLHVRARHEANSKGAPVWDLNKSLQGWEAHVNNVSCGGDAVCDMVFFKPKALMNVSGPPTAKAVKRYLQSSSSYDPSKILFILHDELEIARNTSRFRTSGSLKGHRGLESISQTMKIKEFARFGIGIGRPESRSSAAVSAHVLSPLNKNDLQAVFFSDEGKSGNLLEECWNVLQRTINERIAQCKAKELKES